MVRYTVAIINYNMADTLERSLRSVVDQVTDKFEVVVVDGGSSDGSIKILDRLSDEYRNLRYLVSPYGDDSTRGFDRAVAVSEAAGEYVITHIDTDDQYDEVICDFVVLFHEIETQLEREPVLWGSHMMMAARDHLLELGSYRNLRAGEDMDLFRRAIASDKTVYLELDCDRSWESIGYSRGIMATVLYMLEIHTCDFQAGVTLRSSIQWVKQIDTKRDQLVHLTLLIVAYLRAATRERFEPADGVRDKGLGIFKEHRYSVEELESAYDISIDRSKLSEKGKRYFIR